MILSIVFLALVILFFASIRIIKDFNPNYISKEQTICLKGFCALFIVAHHICFEISDLYSVYQPIYYMGFITVALFLFISGYGLMNSFLTKENYLKEFLKKRLSVLLIPYIILVAIYGVVKYFINGNLNFLDFIIQTILARNVGPLWFMGAITLMYLGFFVIFKNCKPKKGITIFLFYTVIYILVLLIFDFPSTWYSSIIGFWFGLFYRFNENKILEIIKSKYRKYICIFTISFIVLFILRLVISYLGFSSEYFHAPYRNIISILFILMVLAILLRIKFYSRILNFLGKISYELYLVHPFIIQIFKDKLTINSIMIPVIIFLSIMSAFILNFINSKIIISLVDMKNKKITE